MKPTKTHEAQTQGQSTRKQNTTVARGNSERGSESPQDYARSSSLTLTDHQEKIDFAQYLELVADTFYPHISLIRLVTDNLNTHTHTPTALYETFPPEKAHRFCQRFEWHYTPKHAS
jgi:hypothetical protein